MYKTFFDFSSMFDGNIKGFADCSVSNLFVVVCFIFARNYIFFDLTCLPKDRGYLSYLGKPVFCFGL